MARIPTGASLQKEGPVVTGQVVHPFEGNWSHRMTTTSTQLYSRRGSRKRSPASGAGVSPKQKAKGRMDSYERVNEDVAARHPGFVAVKPIRTPADCEEAHRELERLVGCTEGSPEEDLLIVLAALVDAYEAEVAVNIAGSKPISDAGAGRLRDTLRGDDYKD